jgi:hypothetical protein
VDYLQKVEARWEVKLKGTVGREIKRNLFTPCSSCSGRRKKSTETFQESLSGSDESAWKNPRPWTSKKKSRGDDNDDKQGTEKIIRGKVGRSLIRSTVKLATERAKKNKSRIEVESEKSSNSDQEKPKKSTKKFGCTAECPIYYEEKGVWKKCISLCRVMKRHGKSQCRCNDHKGEPENAKSKKNSAKREKEKTRTERDDERLTPEEEKRLREKYKKSKDE